MYSLAFSQKNKHQQSDIQIKIRTYKIYLPSTSLLLS